MATAEVEPRTGVVVDAHVHVSEDGRWFTSGRACSVDALLAEMDTAHVERAVVLPVPGHTRNAFMARVQREHPDRFTAFGSLGTDSPVVDLDIIRESGLKGVKFHPRLQATSLLKWEREGHLQAIADARLPVLVCGWPQSHSLPMSELTPLVIDGVAKRLPQLRLIIAHAGGHWFWDAFFCARSNPNVYLDCSYFLWFFQGTSLARDFFSSLHLIDQKVFFGSDFPEVPISWTLAHLESHLAADADTDRLAVLGGNITALLD